MNRLVLLASLALIFSCDKGEMPIDPHSSGDVETSMLEVGSNYGNQLFYNLETNSVISSNMKLEWDLGFLTSEDEWHVLLNSARGGSVWRINEDEDLDFEGIPKLEDAVWQYDSPDGALDSTAIDDYRLNNEFFVIDRGYSPNGDHTGYMKLKIDSVNSSGYFIRTADLEHDDEQSTFIEKDINLNQVCYSFDVNSTVEIEPISSNWDLLFTQYTNIFYDPFTPYLVVGVLSNTQHTLVSVDSEKSFDEITYDDAISYSYSSKLDAIGFDWKYYDFDAGAYLVNPNINYIIKDLNEQYFKLHFIDFYNEMGEKGFPSFEVQML